MDQEKVRRFSFPRSWVIRVVRLIDFVLNVLTLFDFFSSLLGPSLCIFFVWVVFFDHWGRVMTPTDRFEIWIFLWLILRDTAFFNMLLFFGLVVFLLMSIKRSSIC